LVLGERAVRQALERAGIRPDEVDTIYFSTVTGLASPSVDARLMQRLGFRSDCKRVPMFGLGCVAGAAAVSRAIDYVRGEPDGVAVVLTVELCSLTLQREDRSVANLISIGLFGDGAAAAVVGARTGLRKAPRSLATRSVFYPDTQDVMGWDIGAHGFRIVLSAEVPKSRGSACRLTSMRSWRHTDARAGTSEALDRASGWSEGAAGAAGRAGAARRGPALQLAVVGESRQSVERVGADDPRGDAAHQRGRARRSRRHARNGAGLLQRVLVAALVRLLQ
jgi:hypothetical protein